MKGPMLIFFEGAKLRQISFFSSLHQPQTSHEYLRRIFTMSTMAREDLQHINKFSVIEPSCFTCVVR